MIYLDNAATSGRKPEEVYLAVDDALKNVSGNPGRSGHKTSLKAGNIVYETRLNLRSLVNAEKAENIVFTYNATDALNTVINGILKGNEHVITTGMEHNSVSRVLEYFHGLGSEISVIPISIDDGTDPEDIKKAIRCDTKLVVVNHISNVTGTVNDISAIGKICREAGVLFLVDASQSVGAQKIDVKEMNIDLMAFPGHKSLLGPQGTGALYIRSGLEKLITPLKRGGTGSRSELLQQPEMMPDKFESGTLNVPGIAGLGAGVRFIQEIGEDIIEEAESRHTEMLIRGIQDIPGVKIYAPRIGKRRGSVMSMNVEGMDSQDVGMILDDAFDIAVRAGLHCAPYAHKTLGTLSEGGTVRISPGYFTTEEEINICIDAIKNIAESV